MQTVHPSPEAVRLAMSRIERAMYAHGGDRDTPIGGSSTATTAAPPPATAAGTRSAA